MTTDAIPIRQSPFIRASEERLWTVDASDLGLGPGDWPRVLRVALFDHDLHEKGPVYTLDRQGELPGEDMGYLYVGVTPVGVSIYLEVVND